MNLKRVLLDYLEPDQLKELCAELQVNADRRSTTSMVAALSSAKRAKPERLVEKLNVRQLRALLEQLGHASDGKRDELVQRLLAAAGRGAAELEAPEHRASDSGIGAAYSVQPERGGRNPRTGGDITQQYVHGNEAVQRPEAGVQDQFQAKKPPRTYRYDSSLDPELSWDEQRERDLGEWLLGLIARAARDGEREVFAEAQQWKGGGVRITSLADAAQMLQQISKPFLNWAGKAERHEIRVPTAPLFVHERHSTKAILDGIRHRKARGQTLDLFGDPGMDIRENLEAYEHKGPWQNRMILGDSLAVMNSLLEFEGMAGQVQMIYIDPPYGVKFGSNFQPFVRNRTVAEVDEDMTREPEMVKAYRDTWELGLHSYLTYLRDRCTLAKELLTQSGSLFLQISEDNLHFVREILDEVFGQENFVVCIVAKKTGSQRGSLIQSVNDYLLWYAKDKDACIAYASKLYTSVSIEDQIDSGFNMVELGAERDVSLRELLNAGEEPIEGFLRVMRENPSARLFASNPLTSGGYRRNQSLPFRYRGRDYDPGIARGNCWKHTVRSEDGSKPGMERLAEAGRLYAGRSQLRFKRYANDFPLKALTNWWDGLGGASNPLYVVQTNPTIVARCILMTTKPGDLVLDPTCGSGTTAFVAEQWGRRWITVDTSRVPLALTRQRLLTASFPYYELKDPARGPAGGFVYERKVAQDGREVGGLVPHITSSTIANDDAPAMEIIVDRPEVISGIARVAGPFVVEATIAPVQSLDAAGDGDAADGDVSMHIQRMTEVLRQSKTLRLPGNRELVLAGVHRTVDTEYLHAEAKEGARRVAIVFGPADGAISSTLVFEAAREAYFLKYERLYFFGFAIEPGARALIEDDRKLRIPAAYVAVTPDVAMSDLLKTTRASEIFSVTGLPDVAVRRARKKGPEGQTLYEVEMKGLDLFDPESMDTESIGGESVPCWMLDTDYDGMSFYATQVFFPKTSAWDNLQRSLKATFDDSVWDHLAGTVSEPFALGDRKRVAVKVIDERGNELMRVLDVME